MSILSMVKKRIASEVLDLDKSFARKPKDAKDGIGFMLYALKNIFSGTDFNQLEEGIVDSLYRNERFDYGIDAIYLTANSDMVVSPGELSECNKDSRFIFHILQFKKGTGIDLATLLKLKAGIESVFINDELDKKKNEYMFHLLKDIKECREFIYENYPMENIEVKIYICFSGVKQNVLKESVLTNEIKKTRKVLINAAYSNVTVEILGAQELISLEREKKRIVDILKYNNSFKYITETSGKEALNGYIAIIKTEEIAKIMQRWQNSLFDANIRDYYRKNDINNEIFLTCCKKDEGNYFWSFNNGLTVTCHKVDELPKNKYKLHGLQIVNGCQTTNVLYQAFINRERYNQLKKQRKKTKEDKIELEDLENKQLNTKSTILVKIIETQSPDLIYQITKTTNSQTTINVFNLRANEDIHKNIEQFLKEHKIFYERRVNYYKNLRKKPAIGIKQLAQLYLSMVMFKPSQARSTPTSMFLMHANKIFPSPEVFNSDYKVYLLPILVDLKIRKKIRNIRRKKLESDEYNETLLAYGKFHIECLLLNSILKGKYNEKGIISNFDETKKILDNEKQLSKHFKNALADLRQIVEKVAGKNKDKISAVLKSADLDRRLVKFIKQKIKNK